MARRSSARLRAKQSATPQAQRVSDLGADAIKTPLTAPKLSCLREDEETQPTPVRSAQTPRDGTPIKPSPEEMHPQKYMASTAKPLDEARWLGFSSNKDAQHQTPTKTPKPAQNIMDNAPDFSFTFRRPSLHLSPQARALMAEKKEEAAKIRSEMQDTQKGQPSASDVLVRKIATPAGKVNRFSDVHMKAFKKMDSIADHPSAFRHKDGKPVASDKPSALKRSPSKAELERPASSSSASSLPRPASRDNLDAGPAKRVKRAADDDATTSRPQATPKAESKSIPKPQPTPRTTKSPFPLKSALKSARRTTMIPSSQRSPVRMGMTSASLQHQQQQHQQEKPQEKAKEQPAQLLSRSPLKSPVKSSVADRIAQFEPQPPSSPLLSRSPAKPASPTKPVVAIESPDASSKIPYLARSPAKKAHGGLQGAEDKDGNKEKPSKTPLLARSPAKIALSEDPFNSSQQTPAKPSLLTRFNLLRQSPVKSILRTPQRLYSDDPFKLANGTHLSTPPNADSGAEKAVPPRPPKTAPVIKHVDFSASTKGLENNDSTPDTPTKATSPSSKPTEQTAITYPTLPTNPDDRPKKAHRRMTMAGAPSDFTFRAGEQAITFAPSPRRATSQGATKASIRSVDASPETPATATETGKKRKLSPSAPDRKDASTTNITSDKENDESDQRPAKKARSEVSEPATSRAPTAPLKTPVKKVPTVGVRPKSFSTQKPKEKRPGMLSQARLAMLATPKRR